MSDNSERQKAIGKYGLVGIFLFVSLGLGYGLYHDFTEEYEANTPIVYDIDPDNIHNNGVPHIIDGKVVYGQHGTTIKVGPSGMVLATTVLTEEQMKIQDEQGCVPCHPK
jgi:hypothetical protein